MPDPAFDDIEACVFDAYGTLFDVHSATARLEAELGEIAGALSELWRRKQLQYTWLRTLMDRHESFWQITGSALDHAMSAIGFEEPRLRARLMELYLRLDPYPEAAEVLARLREAGKKTAILSNGDRSMLISAAKNAGLYPLLDHILSVESVGLYKPHPSVYQLAVDRLRAPAGRISFQSSNGWDAHGAAVFGFPTVWINRSGAPPDALPGAPHAETRSLSALPGLLGL